MLISPHHRSPAPGSMSPGSDSSRPHRHPEHEVVGLPVRAGIPMLKSCAWFGCASFTMVRLPCLVCRKRARNVCRRQRHADARVPHRRSLSAPIVTVTLGQLMLPSVSQPDADFGHVIGPRRQARECHLVQIRPVRIVIQHEVVGLQVRARINVKSCASSGCASFTIVRLPAYRIG